LPSWSRIGLSRTKTSAIAGRVEKQKQCARAAGSVGGAPRRKLGATIRCRQKSSSFRTRAAWVKIASGKEEILIGVESGNPVSTPRPKVKRC